MPHLKIDLKGRGSPARNYSKNCRPAKGSLKTAIKITCTPVVQSLTPSSKLLVNGELARRVLELDNRSNVSCNTDGLTTQGAS